MLKTLSEYSRLHKLSLTYRIQIQLYELVSYSDDIQLRRHATVLKVSSGSSHILL